MQSMEEFILKTKEKVIRKIEDAKTIKEKKKIVEDNCFYPVAIVFQGQDALQSFPRSPAVVS